MSRPTTSRRWPARPCGTGSVFARRRRWKASPPTACWTTSWARPRCPGEPDDQRQGSLDVVVTGRLALVALFGAVVVGLLLPSIAGVLAVLGVLVAAALRSEEHTSELQSRGHLVCRLLLEKKHKQ